MGSKTALCSSTWPLCTSICALQTVLWSHETSKRPPGPILERFRTSPGGSGSPTNTVKYDVFAVFHVAPQTTSRSFKSALGRSQNDPQEAPRSSPGRPRNQERPQSQPKSAPERPWRPNEAHMASKSPPEASQSSFWTPRGTIFRLQGGDFHSTSNLPASTFKAALCAKLMQAYVQHRSTRLCHYYMWNHFYMWISTATDSRSIDR